jgi:hypothetical protein
MNIKRVSSKKKSWTSDPASYIRRGKRYNLEILSEEISKEVGLDKQIIVENIFKRIRGLNEPQKTVVYEMCVYNKNMTEYTYISGIPIQRVDKYFSEGKEKLIQSFKGGIENE